MSAAPRVQDMTRHVGTLHFFAHTSVIRRRLSHQINDDGSSVVLIVPALLSSMMSLLDLFYGFQPHHRDREARCGLLSANWPLASRHRLMVAGDGASLDSGRSAIFQGAGVEKSCERLAPSAMGRVKHELGSR